MKRFKFGSDVLRVDAGRSTMLFVFYGYLMSVGLTPGIELHRRHLR